MDSDAVGAPDQRVLHRRLRSDLRVRRRRNYGNLFARRPSGRYLWKLTADTIQHPDLCRPAETDVVDAIDVSISHANADPDILYADDIENDVLYPDTELTVTLGGQRNSRWPCRRSCLGNLVGTKKKSLEVAGATPPYYAMGFKSAKRDGNDRYVWLAKAGRSRLTNSTTPKRRRPRARTTPSA